MKKGKDGIYNKYIKRLLDVVISFTALLVLSSVMIVLAIIIKVSDIHGPVIFRQERIGKNGKVYQMLKFRSMKVNSEHTGSGVYSDSHDERVTAIGRFLRKSSLDELPQLFNVLVGQMSIIGFRSPLTYHPWTWEEYSEEQKHMFDLRPGITGWAQINGRRTVEWDKRIEMNVWYAENVSFALDVKILFKTFLKVLKNSDNENIGTTVHSEAKEMR